MPRLTKSGIFTKTQNCYSGRQSTEYRKRHLLQSRSSRDERSCCNTSAQRLQVDADQFNDEWRVRETRKRQVVTLARAAQPTPGLARRRPVLTKTKVKTYHPEHQLSSLLNTCRKAIRRVTNRPCFYLVPPAPGIFMFSKVPSAAALNMTRLWHIQAGLLTGQHRTCGPAVTRSRRVEICVR